jgi:L-2-hydroxyglutarate oxidase
MIDGGVTVGPNAVLGFAREGYRKGSVSGRDVATFAAFPGFWKVIRHNLRSVAREMRNSLWRKGYLDECRKYCPSLTLEDLLPYEAGIRAQAVRRDGTLEHDFRSPTRPWTLLMCKMRVASGHQRSHRPHDRRAGGALALPAVGAGGQD